MSVRGRKPKPVELKRLEGNPGKRPLPNSPKYPRLTEHPPDELPPLGKSLWRRLMQEFSLTNLLQKTDREALLALCDLYAVYCENMKLVREHGALVKSKGHNQERAAIMVSPAWRVARDALREMEQLWARFGLTPADRTRFDLPEREDPDDPLLALLTPPSPHLR